jgi:ABC-type lipoprotein export system ATPase subunit
MLSTKQLQFKYENGPAFAFPDIQCEKGEHMLIIGESGKGKTTLLHLLAGILKPTRGLVNISGSDIAAMSDGALDRFRGKQIGLVFQTAHFVDSLSVLDNLMLAPFLTGYKTSSDKAKDALTRLNLGHRMHAKPSQLSVGEQQRAAIARAMMNDPSVILADEPTSALDDKNSEEVMNLLEEQAKLTGASLIIVTHDKRLKDRFTKQVSL